MKRFATTIALVALFALAGCDRSEQPEDKEAVAKSAPVELLFAQRYPDAGGNPTDLNAYRGQILVVNFWASWCGPCVEEMPELSELQAELTDKGVQFLGLGIDNAENVREFNSKVKVLYPLLVLGAAGIELGRQFGNENGALPFTVIINRAGQISDKTLGRVDMARLRRVIERVNQEK